MRTLINYFTLTLLPTRYTKDALAKTKTVNKLPPAEYCYRRLIRAKRTACRRSFLCCDVLRCPKQPHGTVYISDRSQSRSYRPYRSCRSYRPYRSYRSYRSHRPYRSHICRFEVLRDNRAIQIPLGKHARKSRAKQIPPPLKTFVWGRTVHVKQESVFPERLTSQNHKFVFAQRGKRRFCGSSSGWGPGFNKAEHLRTMPTVGVAVVGLTNNVPVRLSSSREELPVSH